MTLFLRVYQLFFKSQSETVLASDFASIVNIVLSVEAGVPSTAATCGVSTDKDSSRKQESMSYICLIFQRTVRSKF